MSKDLLLFLVCFSDMFSLLGWTKRSHFRVGPLIHAGSFLTPTGRTTSDLNKMTSHHLARMSEAKQLNCLITIYLLYLPQLWLTPLQKNVPTQRGSPTQTTPLYLIQVCKWLGTPTLLLGVPPPNRVQLSFWDSPSAGLLLKQQTLYWHLSLPFLTFMPRQPQTTILLPPSP
jgi:hypothetical protein